MSAPPPNQKWCSRCQRWLPRTAFFHCAGRHDGLATHCKPCNQAAQRTWRRAHPEAIRAVNRRSYARHRAARIAHKREDRAIRRAMAGLRRDGAPTGKDDR